MFENINIDEKIAIIAFIGWVCFEIYMFIKDKVSD